MRAQWEKLIAEPETWLLRDAAGLVQYAWLRKFRPDSIVWEWCTFQGDTPSVSVNPCLDMVKEGIVDALADAGIPLDVQET